MKKVITSLCVWTLIFSGSGFAADLTSAKITQTVNKVRLLPPGQSATPAKVGASLSGATAIATGRRSRAELEFNDSTLMRIGSSTTFSIGKGSREVNLDKGALLLQTPDGRGDNAVNIRAGGVTAAITGSMGLVSLSRPENRKRKDNELFFKFISVHGEMHLEMEDGTVIHLKPFQMLFIRMDSTGKVIGQPVISTIDGEKLVETSDLMNRFKDHSRLHESPIKDRLLAQFGEKRSNDWTVVTTDSHNRISGLFRKNTIGVNALNRPKPKPVVVQPVQRPRPPQKKPSRPTPPPPPPPPPAVKPPPTTTTTMTYPVDG